MSQNLKALQSKFVWPWGVFTASPWIFFPPPPQTRGRQSALPRHHLSHPPARVHFFIYRLDLCSKGCVFFQQVTSPFIFWRHKGVGWKIENEFRVWLKVFGSFVSLEGFAFFSKVRATGKLEGNTLLPIRKTGESSYIESQPRSRWTGKVSRKRHLNMISGHILGSFSHKTEAHYQLWN